MSFEIIEKKNFGRKIKDNEISVTNNIISLGGDMAKEINKGDHVLLMIDRDVKQIGIKKVSESFKDSYLVSRDENRANCSPHITNKRLCKMIPNKRYKVFKVGEMWIFGITEIVDDRKVAI